MATEIKLPELGEGIDSGDVLEILVSEGDSIEKEQAILEIETDKATASVPSPQAGKVVKILVSEGDTVEVGAALISIEPAGASDDSEDSGDDQPQDQDQADATDSAETGKQESKSDEQPADDATDEQAGQDDEPETKSAKDVKAEQEPQRSSRDRGGPNGEPSGSGGGGRSASPAKAAAAVTAGEGESESGGGAVIAAGPAVRRFAREVGVDLSTIEGSGEGGRITRDDVLEAVRTANQGRTITTDDKPGKEGDKPTDAESDDWGPIRVEKMSRVRRTIAKQMHASWATVPRVTNFDDADVTDLEVIRQKSKRDYAEQGIKLTAMPFIIKAVAMSLRTNPLLNASISDDGDSIIYKDYVNVGIAVDTERGLIVPPLRGADKLSIPNIARELAKLADKVRDGDFSIEDLRGGTFTISNLGSVGGAYSTPIVNVPEVAILLIGRSRRMPIVLENDDIVPRLMMPLSISYDHRLVDGATAARFLNDVIGYLEAPSRLLLAP